MTTQYIFKDMAKTRKTPKLCDCIRFPHQKTKYYVVETGTGKFASGFDYHSNIIWSNKTTGFFYYSDAFLLASSARWLDTIRCAILSVTYPSEKTVVIKRFV